MSNIDTQYANSTRQLSSQIDLLITNTWTDSHLEGNWSSISMSRDGQYIYAATVHDGLLISNVSGVVAYLLWLGSYT
jgi:hypothetical protein